MFTLCRFINVHKMLYRLADSATENRRYSGFSDSHMWPYLAVDDTIDALELRRYKNSWVSEEDYSKEARRLYRCILARRQAKESSRDYVRTGGGHYSLDALPPDFADPVDKSERYRPEARALCIERTDIVRALRKGGIDERSLRIFVWHEIDDHTWADIARALGRPTTRKAMDALRHQGERLHNKWAKYLKAYFFSEGPNGSSVSFPRMPSQPGPANLYRLQEESNETQDDETDNHKLAGGAKKYALCRAPRRRHPRLRGRHGAVLA
jgi:hypothetical protein